MDHSSRGTSIGGIPLRKGEPTLLPDAFVLDVAEAALTLKGRVIREESPGDLAVGNTTLPAGSTSSVQGVVLERTSNTQHHIYVLVHGALSAGSSDTAAIPLPGLSGEDVWFHARDGGFRATSPGGKQVPLAPGSRCIDGASFTVRAPLSRHFCEVI